MDLHPATHLIGDRPPTLEELVLRLRAVSAAHPQSCRLRTVGRSRSGRPVDLFTVQGGPVDVLLLGAPHPDEPFGLATIEALAQYVSRHAETRERYTWHFIPCTDPDGTALNEAWWTSWPPTMESYHRGLYRPAGADQPEWTFPTEHFTAPLPETRAMMTVIDSVRPRLLVSLHSGNWDHCHYMITPGEPQLVGVLAAAADRSALPVASAPSDCAGWDSPGHGVFLLPRPQPAPPDAAWEPTGMSSAHYAARHGALGVFPEVPMWRTGPLVLPADESIAVLDQARAAVNDALHRVLAADCGRESIFTAAVRDQAAIMTYMIGQVHQHPALAADQPLTLTVPLRAVGMLLRHLRDRCASQPRNRALRSEHEAVENEFGAWCRRAQAALRPEPVPVAQAVTYQITTVFAAAEIVAGREMRPLVHHDEDLGASR
ncbi:M14 family zinc carboxypeptidase [Streptomyces sp. NPDC006624]|uniref:M14 family zinc carboxypeptidase n=1 Tax=Streptomyces sp. NPDC006624 TaxID=3154892 RepID=UPI0033ACFEC7